ncbi:GNAT family N-acetyltransferase [Longitalea luteola]|uniref:GNAT family N-acetyltransferase n=1 Tax=Longitalea luteola TaxID=2812563 RepID=UPI001A976EED|nr:GNAT family protein [Longitalea luteola]
MTATKTEYQKFFPDHFTLETPRVLLRLMTQQDFDLLLPLTKDQSIWKYFTNDLSKEQELSNWMQKLLAERAQEVRMPFVVIDKHSNEICGCTSYLNISFYDKRLEIGSTWLGTSFMGTGVNREAKFALLSFAFEVMKMERVEIKTDNLNERAKAALLKVGMKPEGVLRSHMLMHDNRRRDSIYFSILKSEWEERKLHFFPEML